MQHDDHHHRSAELVGCAHTDELRMVDFETTNRMYVCALDILESEREAKTKTQSNRRSNQTTACFWASTTFINSIEKQLRVETKSSHHHKLNI
jgi:hypothetical protein